MYSICSVLSVRSQVKAICTTGSLTYPIMQIILKSNAGNAVPGFVYEDLSFNTERKQTQWQSEAGANIGN